jgi:hypothetical protein
LLVRARANQIAGIARMKTPTEFCTSPDEIPPAIRTAIPNRAAQTSTPTPVERTARLLSGGVIGLGALTPIWPRKRQP